jgi:hypothetical protein
MDRMKQGWRLTYAGGRDFGSMKLYRAVRKVGTGVSSGTHRRAVIEQPGFVVLELHGGKTARLRCAHLQDGLR